ncbi:MAG: hydrogenase expression/formation protein HypE [Dactylosporangium sp.]|nr:hydrogenase expression/formation protein HypE [Dactylosporangium sp.]NNJ62699.1 hydrogenase expression/formation protein HypE [Dactylosporangium sp.]
MTATVQGAGCPVPHRETERILLGHGSGGQLSAALLRDVIAPALASGAPGAIVDDAAVLEVPGMPDGGSPRPGGSLVFSTDAFVVNPREFPGGCIGDLAVNGTINDLAMMGGRPLALSLAYIIEEGLPVEELRRVSAAVGRAAATAGVPIVTGDTKVVGRGAADGIYLVTSGVGVTGAVRPSASRVQAGDAVLLSGPIAAHGMAVMSAREDFGFDAEILSDTAPLHRMVADLLAAAPATHTLRDPTRGGLASALNEIAETAGIGVDLDEAALPVAEPVRAACDLLGLDPMHVANEGICVAFVPAAQASAALAAMRARPEGVGAVAIGRAVADHPGRVTVRTLIGSQRIVDPLIGEQLPRIC